MALQLLATAALSGCATEVPAPDAGLAAFLGSPHDARRTPDGNLAIPGYFAFVADDTLTVKPGWLVSRTPDVAVKTLATEALTDRPATTNRVYETVLENGEPVTRLKSELTLPLPGGVAHPAPAEWARVLAPATTFIAGSVPVPEVSPLEVRALVVYNAALNVQAAELEAHPPKAWMSRVEETAEKTIIVVGVVVLVVPVLYLMFRCGCGGFPGGTYPATSSGTSSSPAKEVKGWAE